MQLWLCLKGITVLLPLETLVCLALMCSLLFMV